MFLFVTPTHAQTNLGSGAASVQIIEDSANQTANALQRQRELSTQSANSTLTETDRPYLDDERNDTNRTPPAEVLLDETVTVEDMGATHARILPDSPWHVFKRIGRGIQEAITIDPVKDAELKRQHAVQELAEVKQLVEERGASAVAPDVITDSLERFQDKLADATDAAKKLGEVKEAEPAAVAAVMADFTDKHIKEQTVLDNLAQDVLSVKEDLSRATEEAGAEETKAVEQILSVVEDTKAESAVHLAGVLVEVEKTPEAISARLTETIGQQKGSAFRDLKHLSVLDEIAKSAPESMQSAVDTAKQETVKKFEEKIKAVPPAVRAEKFKQYVEHANGDEKRLFTLLDEIKQTADIPGDILDKIEEAKEIAVRRFEEKLALIDDSDVQDRLLAGFIGADRVKDVVALEEFKDRMKSGSEAMKRVEDQHEKSVEAFKAKFTDAKSQEQADFFRKLSQEMTENPSPKVFKLVRELEAEVRQDAEKSAFLDGLEKQMQGEIEVKFRREGERYVERYASLDPNDMAVFDAVDFDPVFKKQVLQKKTEKLKDFVKDIERPEEFDRFYERFYKAPDAVIENIKEQSPDFQQAMQFKWRKMEQQRLEEERQHQVNRARVDYEERELTHQFDRVTRKEDEQFFRRLTEIQPDDFEARKELWEEKINRSHDNVDQRFAQQKRLFEERLKIDPFGCDETCRQVQITFIEQDQRHQKERLADQLQSERNRIEADQARQARNNPLAGKCSTPESCIAYCRANQGTPGCEWLAVEVPTACPAPAYWDQASRSCVTPTEVKPACGAGQYWDGKACVADPFYRPPEDFRRCGWGMHWSEDKATCVPDQRVNNCETVVVAGTVSYSENCDVPPVQLCPSDRRWDPLKRDCVPFDYQACGGGFYFDYGTRRCEKEARTACPAGQSWDEAKKICLAIAPERCPAFDILPCPDGHYREFKQTPNGCWLPGACVPVKQICQKEPFPCPIGFSRAQKVGANGCVEYGQCEPPICPLVMPRICAPGETPIPPDLRRDPCGLSSCIPSGPENKCPAYDLYFKSCPTDYRREFKTDDKGCQVPGACVPEKPPGPCPFYSVVECPAGTHREFTNNPDGCSVPGRCVSDTEPVGLSCVTYKTESECRQFGQNCDWREGICKQKEGFVDRCGDNICSGAETPATCPADCKAAGVCNRNGVCDAGETVALCPADCSPKEPPACGNARCETGETTVTCPKDCPAPPPICTTPATCVTESNCRGAGFIWCNTTGLCYREAAACPAPVQCGDRRCEAGETVALCPADCAPASTCGDNICGGTESQATCPADCKPKDTCGDRICSSTETAVSCSVDCQDAQCAGSAYFCRTQDSCLARGSYWCTSRCQVDPCAGGGVTCGNGRCEAIESGKTCPSDCLGANNQCATSPAQCATPADCAANYFYWCNGACFATPCTGGTACNKNGICDAGETVASCAADCGAAACGAGWTYKIDSRSCVRTGVVCSSPKSCDACRTGSAQYCEWNSDGCPIACRSSAFCGNGVCDAGETYGSCIDCRGGTGTGTCATQASLCTTQSVCAGAGYFWCANTSLCYSTQASSPCFTAPAVCGDRICAGTETAANCPADCGTTTVPTCGSYVTQPTCTIHPGCSWYVPPAGTAGSCVVSGSTGGSCDGDRICEVNESAASCPSDCSAASGTCNNDGVCGVGENTSSCSRDCGTSSGETCGNGFCGAGETAATCARDCGTGTNQFCDGICGNGESAAFCPGDCSGAATGCGSRLTQATCTAPGCTWYVPPSGTAGSCVISGSTSGSCNHNWICNAGETNVSCPSDCNTTGGTATCDGDRICEVNESAASCPSDCGTTGGTCATQASLCTTQSACTAAAYFWCPTTNSCHLTQATNPCSISSGTCGDRICGNTETSTSCPVDCATGSQSCTSAPINNYNTAPWSCGANMCPNGCTYDTRGCATGCQTNTTSGACGDHICNSTETAASCPTDCGGGTSSCSGTPASCTTSVQCAGAGYYWCLNNSICYPTSSSCPSTGTCGDRICASGENSSTCPADCGTSTSEICGNGFCGAGETSTSCPADCGGVSNQFCDGICGNGENAVSCPGDCGSTSACASSPSACTGGPQCALYNYYWCTSANRCYSSQAVSPCAVSSAACGNGTCESSESSSSCPADCGGGTTSCSGSPATCTSSTACNNVGYYWCSSSNACYPSYGSSPCGTTTSGACGDHICQSNETVALCPVDCDTGTSSCSSSSAPSACMTQTACSAAGFYWCAASSGCFSSQAVSGVCAPVGTCNNNGVCDSGESNVSCPSDCHSTSLGPSSGRIAWSRDPLGRLATSVGEFAKSIFGFVAKAVGGF